MCHFYAQVSRNDPKGAKNEEVLWNCHGHGLKDYHCPTAPPNAPGDFLFVFWSFLTSRTKTFQRLVLARRGSIVVISSYQVFSALHHSMNFFVTTVDITVRTVIFGILFRPFFMGRETMHDVHLYHSTGTYKLQIMSWILCENVKQQISYHWDFFQNLIFTI